MKIGEIGLEPDRPALTTVEENMIFQSCYKETTQIKSSKLHGHGYLAMYRTRIELMKENLEVHAHAQAVAREKSIALEAKVDKLKEQIAQEAAERERDKEENRRRMQEELENAKINLREEMKQEFLNMLAHHKEGAMIMTQPRSIVTIQKAAPAPTRSTRSTAPPSRALFNENTANVTASKTYITSQQLMNRTRNNPKRRKEMIQEKFD
ncbi:unnamed protein product [Miscanthus lutarioriparius]|uniref:Uncharacterized protein n=1 Tax=Miscanthus lutarioriparius TaxID=422564 RepID=A0A811MNQ9_9POAL|nr:unnamed protein product [Miscanthus lutarioriparius]